MPTSAIIILIIVVWIFVLAPWLLRFQRPVSHTGEAFEDTRVVFNGESGHVNGKRRPRVRATDVRSHFTAEQESDYEIVAAEDVAIAGGKAGEAEFSSEDYQAQPTSDKLAEEGAVHRGFSFRSAVMRARARMKGDDSSAEAILIDEDSAQPETIDGEVVPNRTPSELDSEVTADNAVDEVHFDSAASVTSADDCEVEDAGDAEELTAPASAGQEGETYPLDESFTSPVDLMYPGAVDSVHPADSAELANSADSADTADEAGYLVEDELEEGAGAQAVPVLRQDVELSPEEVAFAQTRSGRGSWDPVRDNAVRATRFQRRQRALFTLLGSLLAAVVAGIVLGGKVWLVAAGVSLLVIWYLVALRNLSVAEQALHRRRVAQLRRARLGVRSVNDEELAIPARLRRPGAIVLESDDESPDFEFLPVYDAQAYAQGDNSAHIINRRELRDELSARRVG